MAAPKNITHDATADVDAACWSEHNYISDKRRYLARLKRIERPGPRHRSNDGRGQVLHRHPRSGQHLGLLDTRLCVEGRNTWVAITPP